MFCFEIVSTDRLLSFGKAVSGRDRSKSRRLPVVDRRPYVISQITNHMFPISNITMYSDISMYLVYNQSCNAVTV